MRHLAIVLTGSVIVSLASVAAGSATSTAPPALEVARRQFEAGDYRTAVTTLRTALEQDPRQAALHYWLGRMYYELHEYDEGIESGQRAVELDPGQSEYHRWLGRLYGEKADQERSFLLARKVRQQFEEAVRLDPVNVAARRDLLAFYLEAPWILGGSDDNARQQVDAIARVDATAGSLARAAYWQSQKQPDRADAEYRRVLERQPQQVDSCLEAADFYEERGDAARMEAFVEAAMSVDGSDQRLPYYRGVVRVLAGDRLTEGERFLKAYLATTPERSNLPSHASAHEWLGRLYEQRGDRDAAEAEYRAALQLDPGRKGTQERLRRLKAGSQGSSR